MKLIERRWQMYIGLWKKIESIAFQGGNSSSNSKLIENVSGVHDYVIMKRMQIVRYAVAR